MIGVIGCFLTLRSSCERLGGLYTLHPSKKDLGCLTSTWSLRFLHSAGLSSALSGAVHFLCTFGGEGPLSGALSGTLLGRAHFLAHFWLLLFAFLGGAGKNVALLVAFFSPFLDKNEKSEKRANKMEKATKCATFSGHRQKEKRSDQKCDF